MKLLYLLPLLFIQACSPDSSASNDAIASSQRKQEYKLLALQKKLDVAEKEQQSKERDVSSLKEQLRQTELALIRNSVEACEFRLAHHQKDDHISTLFLSERERLHKLIQAGSSPVSTEAQIVLDQILRIITNFSER